MMCSMCSGYEMRTMLLIALFFGFVVSYAVSKNDVQLFCPSHNPQKTLDFQSIMGKWYVVEIVDHMAQDGLRHTWEISVPLCPEIEIAQEDFANIKIKWQEDYYTTYYYHAKRNDIRSPGFWTASGPNSRFFESHERHNEHFKGTIEVMKAVNNHLVLTFCTSDDRNSQLFSAVLAKDRWLPRADTAGVNSMLHYRKLKAHLIKHTCNGAVAATTTFAVAAVAMLALVL